MRSSGDGGLSSDKLGHRSLEESTADRRLAELHGGDLGYAVRKMIPRSSFPGSPILANLNDSWISLNGSYRCQECRAR